MFRNTSPCVNVSAALLRLHDADGTGAEHRASERRCVSENSAEACYQNDVMVTG